MSKYNELMKSNYFALKNNTCENELRNIVSSVLAYDDVQIFSRVKDEKQTYAIGCASNVLGIYDKDKGHPDMGTLYRKLQEIVAPNDAIILFAAGNDGLDYVTGSFTCITANDIKYVDMEKLAVKTAANMLDNPEYGTECSYYITADEV